MATMVQRLRSGRFRSWLPLMVCCLSLPFIYLSTAYRPRFVTCVASVLNTLGVLQVIDSLCPPPVIQVGIFAMATSADCPSPT